MILNEAAVKMFGYSSPEQAVGKRFEKWGRGKIIGNEDFHFEAQETIKPLHAHQPNGCNLISVNVSAAIYQVNHRRR
jgi:putative ABC transport system permease protein